MKDISAFPRYYDSELFSGMTLRDYFAAQALTGAQIWDAVINNKNAQLAQGGADKLSEIAYAVADAMMKERQKCLNQS